MENLSGAVVHINDEGGMTVRINSKDAIYAAHMPFIKGGGIFIATHQQYNLGDEVQMLIELLDEVEQIPVKGKVVWQTPAGAQGGLAAGIGVQFLGEEAPSVQKKLHTYVAGMMNSERRTDTM